MDKSTRTPWSEEQVKAYLERDIWPQMKWYEDEAAHAEARLHIWTWIGIVSGLTATIVAAIPARLIGENAITNDFVRYVVVIASAVATLASGTVAPRYRRAAVARELGRVKTTALEKMARIRLTYVPMTEEERATELQRIAERLISIEGDEGTVDVAEPPDHTQSLPSPQSRN